MLAPARLQRHLLGCTTICAALVAARGDARADDVDTCATAAEQAQPLMRNHELRAAREQLLLCARQVCPAVVRADCGRWLDDVGRKIPTVVVTAIGGDGREVTAVRVLLDGKVVAEKIDGGELAADPGDHTLRCELADGSVAEERVTLREGERKHAVVVRFKANLMSSGGFPPPAPPPTGGAAAPPLSPPTPASPPPVPPSSDAVSTGSESGTRTVVVLTLAGAALVSAGLGVFYGLQSKSQADKAAGYRQQLGPSGCYNVASKDCSDWSAAVDGQNSDATLNKVFLAVGGVFAAGALLTWLAWPTATSSPASGAAWSVSPLVAPGGGGLRVGASY